jgi:hypothetical protein
MKTFFFLEDIEQEASLVRKKVSAFDFQSQGGGVTTNMGSFFINY